MQYQAYLKRNCNEKTEVAIADLGTWLGLDFSFRTKSQNKTADHEGRSEVRAVNRY